MRDHHRALLALARQFVGPGDAEEVVSDADAFLDGELSPHQRLSLWMHLLICVPCRRYI